MKVNLLLFILLFLTLVVHSQQNATKSADTDSLSLTTRMFEIEEINVNVRLAKINLLSGSTGVLINLEEIKMLPNIVGDADPYISLKYTGGITQAGEGNSGLYVRGGNNDQNLILLNGTSIQNPTHVLGMFSIFNPDIITKMRFIKSGMPAEFGGRLASVIEVTTDNNHIEKASIDGSVGLISSRIAIQLPVSEKISAYGAFRGSYLNTLVLPALTLLGIDSLLTKNQYQYIDANAGLIFQLNRKTKISSHFYYGKDNILINEIYKFSLKDNRVNWDNKTANLQLNHVFNENWSMLHSLSYSAFQLSTNLQWSNSQINLNTEVENYNYKADFFHVKNNHQIKFGTELISIHSNPHYVTADSLLPVELDNEHNLVSSAQLSGYVRDEFQFGNLLFNIGLRANTYAHIGPYIDYMDEDQHEYKKNELIKTYFGIEPRFFARYLFSNQSSIKAAATRHIQYQNQVPAINIGIPIDLQIPSGLHVLPQTSWHFSSGYFRNFSNNRYETSVEVYYKTLNNQLEYNNGLVETFSNRMVEKNIFVGKGWAYGMELKLKRSANKFTGWISYNLAWNYRQFNELNKGEPFLAKNDRRHDLSLVGMYQLNDRLSFSALFVYASGNRLNLPLSWFVINNKIVLEYGNYNAFEMPAYHRLDLSANYKLRPFKRVKSELNLSIYNLYNRANPFQVYYKTSQYDPNKNYDFSFGMSYLLPIIPTLSWTFHFE
ncbi:MAG: TonB-dependent receptor plug domain-containing protein [Prolixibacteraceae bacterium]